MNKFIKLLLLTNLCIPFYLESNPKFFIKNIISSSDQPISLTVFKADRHYRKIRKIIWGLTPAAKKYRDYAEKYEISHLTLKTKIFKKYKDKKNLKTFTLDNENDKKNLEANELIKLDKRTIFHISSGNEIKIISVQPTLKKIELTAVKETENNLYKIQGGSAIYFEDLEKADDKEIFYFDLVLYSIGCHLIPHKEPKSSLSNTNYDADSEK